MTTAAVDESVLEGEDVLREPEIAGGLRAEAREAADVDVADGVLTGHEGPQFLRRVRLTFCPMCVRPKPKRKVLSVVGESVCRYSAVRNWLRERNERGNCG